MSGVSGNIFPLFFCQFTFFFEMGILALGLVIFYGVSLQLSRCKLFQMTMMAFGWLVVMFQFMTKSWMQF